MALELIDRIWVDPNNLELSIETSQDSLFAHHKVKGFYKRNLVGYVTIERKLLKLDRLSWADTPLGMRSADYSFYLSKDHVPKEKPVVSHQWTEKRYRGSGICGHLIVAGNEFCKKEFGTPLHSISSFDSKIFKVPLLRVWEKLAKEGKAYEYKFYEDKRFGMY